MIYVVDYDEGIITPYDSEIHEKGWEHFNTWEDAKISLIDYWGSAVFISKQKLREVKKLKKIKC